MLQFLTTVLLFPHRFKLLFTEVPKKDVQRFKNKNNKQTNKQTLVSFKSQWLNKYVHFP